MNWKGVMPAITTSFTEDLRIDHRFMAEHCRLLLENGCAGVVALGSLGEGATLSFEEKLQVLRTLLPQRTDAARWWLRSRRSLLLKL